MYDLDQGYLDEVADWITGHVDPSELDAVQVGSTVLSSTQAAVVRPCARACAPPPRARALTRRMRQTNRVDVAMLTFASKLVADRCLASMLTLNEQLKKMPSVCWAWRPLARARARAR